MFEYIDCDILIYLICLTYLICLIYFIYLIYFIHSIYFIYWYMLTIDIFDMFDIFNIFNIFYTFNIFHILIYANNYSPLTYLHVVSDTSVRPDADASTHAVHTHWVCTAHSPTRPCG